MLHKDEKDKFRDSTIAQTEDHYYDDNGYVIVKIGEWCAIGRYGLSSCCDDWESLTDGEKHDPDWDWTGGYDELLDMARRVADPAMPERSADPSDCDYQRLVALYAQLLT